MDQLQARLKESQRKVSSAASSLQDMQKSYAEVS